MRVIKKDSGLVLDGHIIKNGRSFYVDKTIVQRLDKIQYKCKACNKLVERNFCSLIETEFLCSNCKREKTCLDKYGSKNNFQSPKTKQTLETKWGGIHPNAHRDVKDKKKESYLKNYGVDNPFKSSESREKARKTSLEKYGSETYNNIEKIKKTNLEKYGVEFAIANSEIKSKAMIAKHGVSHNSYLKSSLDKKKETFFNNAKERLKDYVELISDISDYSGREKYFKLKWKCKKCDSLFESSYANGLVPRCFNCNPIVYEYSKIEKDVTDFIKSLNVSIKENDRSLISPLEIDIVIQEFKLAIEFDGLYWHSELNGKHSNYHLDKTKKCRDLNIELLHIFEDEWNSKKDIVKSIIKSKLNKIDKTIFARKCVIMEIDNKLASEFYDINHIQGACSSKINLGLFLEEELVSCLSMSKPRFNKNYEWEITRFANLLNTRVQGSFGKLWSYFLKTYRPESIMTYSDKRYFDGSVYKKFFTELKDSEPNYWYFKEDGLRYSRIQFQKHKLKDKLEFFDQKLTEWENMQLNGWDRIWDCGNKKFIYVR